MAYTPGDDGDEFKAEEAVDVFRSLEDQGNAGKVSSLRFLDALQAAGLGPDDPRLAQTMAKLASIGGLRKEKLMDEQTFFEVTRQNSVLINKALQGKLIVPQFQSMTEEFKSLYNSVAGNQGGANASYIPELARVNPKHFAVSVCTIDGQRWSYGGPLKSDQKMFCVQSCSKPISYLMALSEQGHEKVHHHVGQEPSGVSFNNLCLKPDVGPAPSGQDTNEYEERSIPHNPMINAGAIMSCSLIRPGQAMSRRFGHVMDTWTRLCGNTKIGFANSVYLSEKDTADRNWCLGYMMQEYHSFPDATNLRETLEFYFQTCSIDVTCEQMAILAASLANGGTCPTTGDKVFEPSHVRNCLSLMLSCGMYDYSGEWAFSVGLPAKSGVAGCVFLVVPNKMGIAVWSPRLDENGNSVRGIEFAKALVQKYNFHQYDDLKGVVKGKGTDGKQDPTLKRSALMENDVIALLFAAAEGDVKEVQQLQARGVDLFAADYDARTALHLAASEGHANMVRFLVTHARSLDPSDRDKVISARDRWCRTPLDDAYSGDFKECIKVLEECGAKRNS